jgi:hypothetical protein
MTVYAYIDNEVPELAEWTLNGVPARLTAAAWPHRGSYGMRCAAPYTYGRKNFSDIAVAAGGSTYIGLWMRVNSWPSVNRGGAVCIAKNDGLTTIATIYTWPNGRVEVLWSTGDYYRHDGLVAGRWYYLALCNQRATSAVAADGRGRFWLDGLLVHTTPAINNWSAAGSLGRVEVGQAWTNVAFSVDVDEVKVADEYPEPHTAEPAGSYPCAESSIILYRSSSADSRTFAEWCCDQLGLPYSHCVPLPNATATENLASYADWQAQVETDLLEWLSRHPILAARLTTIVLGFGVPGAFSSGGVLCSGTSRLANLATAFSLAAANPAYETATRLALSDLAGLYTTARIDAATLAGAQAIFARSPALGSLEGLKLVSDAGFAAARTALWGQQMRLPTELHEEATAIAGDAIVITSTPAGYTVADGSAGAAMYTGADACTSLRGGASELLTALNDGAYAAAAGQMHTGVTTFSAESFCKVLRAGGTVGEAALAAASVVDGDFVLVGWPHTILDLPASGYNLYGGATRASVDFATLLACAPPGVGNIRVAHGADADSWYAIRAISEAGVESEPRFFHAVTVGGALLGPPPNRINWAKLDPAAAGRLRLSFRYLAEGQQAPPAAVQVAPCTGPGGAGVDWGSLIDTISIGGETTWSGLLPPTYAHGTVVYAAVRAVSATGVAGEPTYSTATGHDLKATADAEGPPGVAFVQASQA